MPAKKTSQKQISPLVDTAFKWLFANEYNKDILASFLSALLDQDKSDFENLHIENSETLKENKKNKKCYLDVHIKLKNGQHINLEMQQQEFEGMKVRTVVYISKMMSSSIAAGTDYEEVKKCVTINLLNYTLFLDDRIHRVIHLCDAETKEVYEDILEIHFFELPKLKNRLLWESQKKTMLQWLLFLRFPESQEVREMVADVQEIQKAYAQLNLLQTDKQAYYRYLAEEKAINDELAIKKFEQRKERERLESEKRIQEGKKELEEGKKELEEGKKELKEGKKKIKEGKIFISKKEAEIAKKEKLLAEKSSKLELEIQQKLEQNALEATIKSAQNFKSSGVDSATISACTGLSIEQVEKL